MFIIIIPFIFVILNLIATGHLLQTMEITVGTVILFNMIVIPTGIVGFPIIFSLIRRSHFSRKCRIALNLLCSWIFTIPILAYAWLNPEYTIVNTIYLKQGYTCIIYADSGVNITSTTSFYYEIRNGEQIVIPKLFFTNDEMGGKKDDQFEALYADYDAIIGIVKRPQNSTSQQQGELIAIYHRSMNATWTYLDYAAPTYTPQTLKQWRDIFAQLKQAYPELPVPRDFSGSYTPPPPSDGKSPIFEGRKENYKEL
jgi:hypothetical protein